MSTVTVTATLTEEQTIARAQSDLSFARELYHQEGLMVSPDGQLVKVRKGLFSRRVSEPKTSTVIYPDGSVTVLLEPAEEESEPLLKEARERVAFATLDAPVLGASSLKQKFLAARAERVANHKRRKARKEEERELERIKRAQEDLARAHKELKDAEKNLAEVEKVGLGTE